MGRTGQHDRFAVVLPGKKQQGSAPHPAGGRLLFLLGRNGHDGSADASPGPLLLAPDPFSLDSPHTRHGTTWAVTKNESIGNARKPRQNE